MARWSVFVLLFGGATAQSTCALPSKTILCEPSGDVGARLGCETCIVEQCCAEATVCSADAACVELLDCTDASCLDTSNAPFQDLLACRDRACGEAECTFERPADACGDAGNTLGILGPGACALCLANACCDDARACADDKLCGQAADCIVVDDKCATDNANPGCYDNCRGFAETDIDVLVETSAVEKRLLECAADHCADVCRTGANFDCVDDYSWPRADSVSEVTVNFRLTRVGSESQVFSGVTVTPCNQLSTDTCNALGAADTTEQDGLAGVVVPVDDSQSGGFRGLFFIDGDGTETGRFIYKNGRVEYRNRPGDDVVPLPTIADIELGRDIVGTGGPPLDPALGAAVGAVLDCRVWPHRGHFADGIQVQVDGEETMPQIVYVINGTVPSREPKETDNGGSFIAYNLKVGTRIFRFMRGQDEVATMEVFVPPSSDRFVILGIPPNPRP